jgi:hypothetical protein
MACARWNSWEPGRGATPYGGAFRIRLWRMLDGRVDWIFTFSGCGDGALLEHVLDVVRRLIGAMAAEWYLEVLASGASRQDLADLDETVAELRHHGVHPQLFLAPHPRPGAVTSIESGPYLH